MAWIISMRTTGVYIFSYHTAIWNFGGKGKLFRQYFQEAFLVSFRVKPLPHILSEKLQEKVNIISQGFFFFFFFCTIVQVYFAKTTETYKSSAFPGRPVSNCPLYEMIYAKRKSSGDPVIFISYSSFEFRMVLVRKNLPAKMQET